MLMPKRVKFRKSHRRPLRGMSKGAKELAFGDYGLQVLESFWMTARQIEAVRMTISRHLKKGGKMWIRVFPDVPYTKKPAETRMGKGKGNPEYWVAGVKRGRIIFEIGGVSKELALDALRAACHKLPVKARIVMREGLEGEA